MARSKLATDKAPEQVSHTRSSVVTEVPKPPKLTDEERVLKMNDIAKRQWEGQSSSLSTIERVGRIRAGAKGHGFVDILDKLELPIPRSAYEKYL